MLILSQSLQVDVSNQGQVVQQLEMEKERLTQLLTLLRSQVGAVGAEVNTEIAASRKRKAGVREDEIRDDHNNCIECDIDMEDPIFATQCDTCTGWWCNKCAGLEVKKVSGKFYCPDSGCQPVAKSGGRGRGRGGGRGGRGGRGAGRGN